MATSSTKALTRACSVTISSGRTFFSRQRLRACAAFARKVRRDRGIQLRGPPALSWDQRSAGMVPLPGSARPIDLAQAVHGIRREHAGAASAARAGAFRERAQGRHRSFCPTLCLPTAFEDGDQVRAPLARQHRPAAEVHGWDVDARHGVVHGGDDLVAVGDADPRVARMRADNRFDFVRNQLARRQGILHAEMAHSNAVANGAADVGVPHVEAEGFQLFADDGADCGPGGRDRESALVNELMTVTKGFFRSSRELMTPSAHHQRGRGQHMGAFGDDAAALFADILDSRVHKSSLWRATVSVLATKTVHGPNILKGCRPVLG